MWFERYGLLEIKDDSWPATILDFMLFSLLFFNINLFDISYLHNLSLKIRSQNEMRDATIKFSGMSQFKIPILNAIQN